MEQKLVVLLQNQYSMKIGLEFLMVSLATFIKNVIGMQICMVVAKKRVFQKDIMQQENDSCKPSILAFPFDTYLYS